MAPTLFDAMRTRGLSAGDVVVSLAGHDRGKAHLVLSVEPPFARLADGDLRRYEKPKRKRLSHVRPIGRIRDADRELDRVASIRDGPAREAAVRTLLAGFFESNDAQRT
jgi:ribosomal protein L14E/L6E/L27E